LIGNTVMHRLSLPPYCGSNGAVARRIKKTKAFRVSLQTILSAPLWVQRRVAIRCQHFP